MAAEADAVPSPALSSDKTSNLGLRLAFDAVSALAAGCLVAPVVSMIDRAIIQNAAGRKELGSSLMSSHRTLALRPPAFIFARPFALILTVYSSTYLSANFVDTASSSIRNKPPSYTTSGAAKFAATSATNLSLSLYKDAQFTKLFGDPAAVSRKVPGPTFALFMARDCLTVFASFNVPALLAPALPLSEGVERYASRLSVAQFVAPAAVQLASTPLHLLGLDLYNRPEGTGRAAQVAANWLKSSLARMARIVPAFGVGGVVNTRVRRVLMERLE